jgi:LacI family transcriptional regulator
MKSGRTGRARGGASLIDVARAAGVSTATAGRVLGGYGYASEPAAERVRSAARALGYRPNRLARGLITGRTQTIGVVASDIASPFYSAVIRGVADAVQNRGFGVLVTNSDERLALEQQAVRLLLEKQVDGIIIAPCDLQSSQHLKEALESGCPIVQIDRAAVDLQTDSIAVDNVGTARACVRSLTDAGHRRIGFVGEVLLDGAHDLDGAIRRCAGLRPDERGVVPSVLRFAGYLTGCRDAGIAPDPNLIRRLGVYSAAAARAAVLDLMTGSRPPTALFTADGAMSTGALEAIGALGVDIPGDLSLICFDDLDWMQFYARGVSAASQPAREIGALAADLLLRRIEGDRDPVRHIVLPVAIVARRSVAPPRRARPRATKIGAGHG